MPVLDINKLACEVFDIEANAILRLKSGINEDFDKAIDLLYNSRGKVIITGMGKSGLIGKKIAATSNLNFNRYSVIFLAPCRKYSWRFWDYY